MIRFSLRNPYLVVVMVLMTVVVGVVSLARIPADLLPTFETSAVQIVTFYPGMPPEVMEQDIMSRLQRWTGQSAGIEHQEAKAMQGVCVVKDFFHPEITSSEAISQVSALAMSDMFYLPPGTIPPMVMPFDPTASVPLCLVTVSNPLMDDKELYEVAYKNLRNNLQSIPGVIAPAVYGGKLRRILAYVDPKLLAEHNLTILDVHAALRQQNVLIPAGSAKIGDTEFFIYTNAIPDKVSLLNNAPIKRKADGSQVLFKHIGSVNDAAAIQTNKVRVNGRTLVYVPVYRQPGANTIEIVDRIHGKLAEIRARLIDEKRNDPVLGPKMEQLGLSVVMDQSVKVRESVRALWIAGALGALFAGLIVFLFLRNWRSTVVVLLAIPVSILTSMIGLYFTGNTINAMTLGGLALAVGILIDQAIVVIDNIERHLNMGQGPMQSAHEGTAEVAMPLLVSTATFIVVFFPIIFLSGLAKFLFTPLAWAVLFAIVASYLIAMFFVPVAAARLMKRRPDAIAAPSGNSPRKDLLGQGYLGLLRGALRLKWIVLAVAGALFVGSLFLMAESGRELFPPVDSGQFTIYVRAKSGTKIERTEEIAKRIEEILVEELGDPAPDNPVPYRTTVRKFAGGGTLDAAAIAKAKAASKCRLLISNIGVLMDWPAAYTPNAGNMDAFLLVQMKEDAKADVFAIVKRLRKRLNDEADTPGTILEGVEFAFDTGGILTAALNMGEPSPIHLQVTGYNIKSAQKIASRLKATVAGVKGTTDVRVAQKVDSPMIEVLIDRVRAKDLGVTPEEVMKNLVSALNSSIGFDPTFWIDPANGNHYFLGTQYFETEITSLDTLRQITIKVVKDRHGNETPIPLEDVAQLVTNQKVPSVINHRNITRVTDIFANVEPGYDIGSVVAEIERRLTDENNPLKIAPITDSRAAAAKYPQWLQDALRAVGLNPPTRYGFGHKDYAGKFTLEIQGEIRSMRDSFVDFALGLVLATVLVYLVMVAQFRSFLDPFIVLMTVPLGFIGVAGVLFLTGTRLNIQSFMGIIMMIGIVVEYSIVMLDFANHRMAEGAGARQAIVEAARVRFRPILMTSLTTILALLPMSIGFAGGEADIPLARTIVGGVIAATLLLFFVVPCLYAILKRPPRPVDDPEPGWK
ncbi:MAG: efflux RND transporter permease subunit [Planctomycetaceae bacterium]